MKNIVKLLSLIMSAVVICGCDKAPQQQKTSDFPKNMEKELTNQIKVNAEFVYPESCKNGKVAETQIGGDMFWDKQEEIVKQLIGDMKVTNEYTDDYGTEMYTTYEIADNNAVLTISDNNYLNYATGQATYVNNVLFSDKKFDDYNGDKYQRETDLPFMTQREAWEKVRQILDGLGVEVSDNITCYVMDYTTMEEEKAAIMRAEEDDTKVPTAKMQWSEEDDCYYFMTYTTWQDYPVLPPVMGEGTDENNVSVIYNKNGIQSLSINGYYPLELKSEAKLQNPDSVIRALEEYLGNIITDSTYEIQKLSLCQKVIQINSDKHSADIVPVWECSVWVKDNDQESAGYLQKVYFHAETLKVVG